MKPCIVCKKPFNARNVKHVYCTSPECYRAKRRAAYARKTKVRW